MVRGQKAVRKPGVTLLVYISERKIKNEKGNYSKT